MKVVIKVENVFATPLGGFGLVLFIIVLALGLCGMVLPAVYVLIIGIVGVIVGTLFWHLFGEAAIPLGIAIGCVIGIIGEIFIGVLMSREPQE